MDLGYYPYGWFPHVGLEDGPEAMQMQQGTGFEDPMMDFMDFGPEYGDAMAGQGMHPNSPRLVQGAQNPMAGYAFDYGEENWMDPRMDTWLEKRGLPLQYGGPFDDSKLYNLPHLREGYDSSWWGANPDFAYDGGMRDRPLSHNYPRRPDQPLYANARLHGHGEDAALAQGVIGGRLDAGTQYAQMLRDNSGRSFMMGPYAPSNSRHLDDFPQALTREDFLQEHLPMDTAWQRNMRRQTPLTLDDRRYLNTGPLYRQPNILDRDERRVHFG